MHLWMETYLFYCSVRLGMIVVAILTLLQLMIPSILFLAIGIKIFDPIVSLFESDEHYNKDVFVKKVLSWMEKYPTNFMLIINAYLFLHIGVCIVAIIGALRLLRWFLMPFIILELVRVIYCLTWHILLMIMLKKILNLGVLITFTLLGGFLILYLGYNWAASVALFQIIDLIHSARYRTLYGDDPFAPYNPLLDQQFAYGTIENVRVLVTPNEKDVDEQKQINAKLKPHQPQPVVSVIPVNRYASEKEQIPADDGIDTNGNKNRLWQPEQDQPQLTQNYYNNNDYSVNYGNWQWTELMRGAKQQSSLIGHNWRLN